MDVALSRNDSVRRCLAGVGSGGGAAPPPPHRHLSVFVNGGNKSGNKNIDECWELANCQIASQRIYARDGIAV